MHARLALSLLAVLTFAASGCATHSADSAAALDESSDAIRSKTTWFRARRGPSLSDVNRRMEVRAADTGLIACPGGLNAQSCLIDSMDWSALRMPAEDLSEIQNIADAGRLLIQGTLKTLAGRNKLVVSAAFENVYNGGKYYDQECEHAYLTPTPQTGTYHRGARLVGAAYNDTRTFRYAPETDEDVVMDARELVGDALRSTKGLLVCSAFGTSFGVDSQYTRAVLLNVKDTYAP